MKSKAVVSGPPGGPAGRLAARCPQGSSARAHDRGLPVHPGRARDASRIKRHWTHRARARAGGETRDYVRVSRWSSRRVQGRRSRAPPGLALDEEPMTIRWPRAGDAESRFEAGRGAGGPRYVGTVPRSPRPGGGPFHDHRAEERRGGGCGHRHRSRGSVERRIPRPELGVAGGRRTAGRADPFGRCRIARRRVSPSVGDPRSAR